MGVGRGQNEKADVFTLLQVATKQFFVVKKEFDR